MNQRIKFPKILAVYNAELNKVAATAYFQLFADPSLVVFNAFPLNDKASGYFSSGEAVGDEG